ncbi:MAG: hypothetical protein WBD26_02800, partial [Candidatus Acidiferrales bacterium]
MSRRKGIALVAMALAVSLAGFSGCQETAKNSAKVRPPAGTPQPKASPTLVASVGELPLPANPPD